MLCTFKIRSMLSPGGILFEHLILIQATYQNRFTCNSKTSADRGGGGALSLCKEATACRFTLVCAFYWRSLGDCTNDLVAGSWSSEEQFRASPLKRDCGNAGMAGCLDQAWCSNWHLVAEALWALMHINEIRYVIPRHPSAPTSHFEAPKLRIFLEPVHFATSAAFASEAGPTLPWPNPGSAPERSCSLLVTTERADTIFSNFVLKQQSSLKSYLSISPLDAKRTSINHLQTV